MARRRRNEPGHTRNANSCEALYPLWRVRESSPLLYYVCQWNPFTHAVDLIRFSLHGKISWMALVIVAGTTTAFLIAAIIAYDPTRGFIARRGGPGGNE